LDLTSAFTEIITVPSLAIKEEIYNVLDTFRGTRSEKEKIAGDIDGIPVKHLLHITRKSLEMSGGDISYEHFMIAYNDYYSHRKNQKY
jgi:hypothetical protein